MYNYSFISGQHKRLENDNARCCWECISCVGNTYTNFTDASKCENCPYNYWTNKQHTGCKIIQNIYLEHDDYWAIAILALSSLGVSMLLFTVILFFYNHNTPVIRASSRGLCYLILVGIGLLFMLPLTIIGKPTPIRCKLQPYVTGIAMAVNIGMFFLYVPNVFCV